MNIGDHPALHIDSIRLGTHQTKIARGEDEKPRRTIDKREGRWGLEEG